MSEQKKRLPWRCKNQQQAKDKAKEDNHQKCQQVKGKAKAVEATVRGAIGEHCPATCLRKKENSILYLDPDSAALL